MKTLNLDEFAVKEKRVVVLDGEEHSVKEMSVADFIAASVDAEKLEAATEQSVAANFEKTVTHLARSLPTIGETKLRSLSIPQLAILTAYVNGQLADLAKEGSAAAESVAEGEAGK